MSCMFSLKSFLVYYSRYDLKPGGFSVVCFGNRVPSGSRSRDHRKVSFQVLLRLCLKVARGATVERQVAPQPPTGCLQDLGYSPWHSDI